MEMITIVDNCTPRTAKKLGEPKKQSGATSSKGSKKTQSAIPQGALMPREVESLVKENRRLNALVAKLTASGTKDLVKRQYLDESQLARRWGMSVKHVRNKRYDGTGPKVTNFGRAVRYRLRHIVAYEDANVFQSASDRDVQAKLKS